MEESIYNLIPPQIVIPPKQPRYVSKHNPKLAPTATTFCPNNSSKLFVNNCAGTMSLDFIQYDHKSKANKNTQIYTNPQFNSNNCYLRNHQSTNYITNTAKQSLKNIEDYKDTYLSLKPQLPKINQKPILRAKSQKNFILSNAIQAILSQPKRQKQNVNFLTKKDYGKVPTYLQQMKNTLQAIEAYANTKIQSDNENIKILGNEQIAQLIGGLKQRWSELNLQYQKIAHMKITSDQLRAKMNKSRIQGQMQQIQKDIKKLNKEFVVIRA